MLKRCSTGRYVPNITPYLPLDTNGYIAKYVIPNCVVAAFSIIRETKDRLTIDLGLVPSIRKFSFGTLLVTRSSLFEEKTGKVLASNF